MKKIILILISLLFLAGCMEKEVSELQARAGVKYEIKSEIPFTGKLIKRYENGLKKLEEHYDNGKLSEVEGSREGTFSQWNAKSNNERTQASSEERSDRGDPYCQRKLERLGVRFSNPSNGCP